MHASIRLGLAGGLGVAALMASPQIAAADQWNPPHHGHHHRNGSAAGAFAAGTFLGFALGGFGNGYGYRYAPVYPSWSYGAWNAHVAYCQSRHPSYNPSSNLYLTYHHGWQPCHSPYGW